VSSKRLLDSIELPRGVKKLDEAHLKLLCSELRKELVSKVSRTGGHLASNLGAVELTVALHKVFDSPHDEIVWDVGHQCYSHKLLTGRSIDGIRTEGKVSGFPKPSESEHDTFIAGHASNSISAALGIATAKALKGDNGTTIAVVGDGAFSGGMIYEALNNAGRSGLRLIVILNDNEMSISKNVGAMARYLTDIRSQESYFRFKDDLEKGLLSIPAVGKQLRDGASRLKTALKDSFYGSNFFEHFGFYYLGPVDGHDISMLCRVLERAKQLDVPVLVHVNTVKGKGYAPAERNPSMFHGVAPFDPVTGELLAEPEKSFSDVFGETLVELAENDGSICAITAAMKDGTGLLPFSIRYPKRFFDVGIAEEHAVTFAAGLAAGGEKPVLAIYSTFLQRAVDQLIHDASIEPRHVVLGIDRAGIVGGDGETHQGIFDVSLLTAIPGITIYSPCVFEELRRDIATALLGNGLMAVRYPRSGEPNIPERFLREYGDYDLFEKNGSDTLIVAYGRMFANAAEAADDCGASLLKLGRIWPIPKEAVALAAKYKKIYFFEESEKNGSIAEHFGIELFGDGYKGSYHIKALSGFIPHMSVESAMRKYGLDAESIAGTVNAGRCEDGE